MITRVTYDIERIREVTVVSALPLITNTLTMMGMLGVMSKKVHRVAKQQRKREGVAANVAEAIGAIQVVKVLSLQSRLEKTFAKQNNKSLKESVETQELRAGPEKTVEV